MILNFSTIFIFCHHTKLTKIFENISSMANISKILYLIFSHEIITFSNAYSVIIFFLWFNAAISTLHTINIYRHIYVVTMSLEYHFIDDHFSHYHLYHVVMNLR